MEKYLSGLKSNMLMRLCKLTLGTALVCSGAMAQADVKGIILFDVTGSMSNGTRTAANSVLYPTRCEYAKEVFKTKLDGFIGKFNGDYLDVRTFSGPGSLKSINGGFVNIGAMNSSQLLTYRQNIINKVNALTCPGASTALGDAACESIDSLKAQHRSGDKLMLTFITDAGENGSTVCSNRATYVENHIKPRAKAAPKVAVSVSILQSGNVDKAGKVGVVEPEANDIYDKAGNITLSTSDSEIESLKRLATETGGTYSIVYDGNGCEGDCDGIDNGGGDPGEEW